jgi:hypothetical protein
MGRRRSPYAWLASQRPTTLLTIRLLILVNAAVLAVVGGLYLAFAAPPGGPIAAVVIWLVAAVVLSLLPATKTPRDGR